MVGQERSLNLKSVILITPVSHFRHRKLNIWWYLVISLILKVPGAFLRLLSVLCVC